MIQPKDFFLTFVKKEQVANDAYSFYFARPKDFDFLPGQYIRMTLDIANPDERGKSCFFSISSSPAEKEYIRITTRIIQSTFKKTLLSLTPETKVKFFGPVGIFVLRVEETMPKIFLAGGIGITPFLSMVSFASENNITTPITLFVSFTKVEEMIYYQMLKDISQKHSNITIVFTVTHPEESKQEWHGETGRISEELIKKYVGDVLQSLFYIAGPPAMVSAMLEIVQSVGVADQKIRKENFVGY